MIDHSRVARDVVIAASVTGTTAEFAVNAITTVISAATDDELRTRLVRRAVIVAVAIDLPVQMTITSPDGEQVLLVAPDGETEVVDALLPEAGAPAPARHALVAAAAVAVAALVVVAIVQLTGDAPGRSPVAAAAEAAAEASASNATSRSTATIADGRRDPLPLQRGADVRVVSSAPAAAGGLTVRDPIEKTAPAATEQPAPTTAPPSTTPPPAPPTNDGGGDDSHDGGGGQGDQPEPPEPVDPNDVPDPIDPDDL